MSSIKKNNASIDNTINNNLSNNKNDYNNSNSIIYLKLVSLVSSVLVT